jgi:hypothetical protein
MAGASSHLFTAPVFLAPAFLVFGMAIVEKVLNIFGAHIPLLNVYPRQLLDWAVVLVLFEIALSLRQMFEYMIAEDRESAEEA